MYQRAPLRGRKFVALAAAMVATLSVFQGSAQSATNQTINIRPLGLYAWTDKTAFLVFTADKDVKVRGGSVVLYKGKKIVTEPAIVQNAGQAPGDPTSKCYIAEELTVFPQLSTKPHNHKTSPVKAGQRYTVKIAKGSITLFSQKMVVKPLPKSAKNKRFSCARYK